MIYDSDDIPDYALSAMTQSQSTKCPHPYCALVSKLRAELEAANKRAERAESRLYTSEKIERDLSDELEAARAENERLYQHATRIEHDVDGLTTELAESRKEAVARFERCRKLAQEVLGRDSDIARLTAELANTHRNRCTSCDESSYYNELAKAYKDVANLRIALDEWKAKWRDVTAELAAEKERREKAEALLKRLLNPVQPDVFDLAWAEKVISEAEREKGASDD